MITLTSRELELLMHLVNLEMNQICGDLGYAELSVILEKLGSEYELTQTTETKTTIVNGK